MLDLKASVTGAVAIQQCKLATADYTEIVKNVLFLQKQDVRDLPPLHEVHIAFRHSADVYEDVGAKDSALKDWHKCITLDADQSFDINNACFGGCQASKLQPAVPEGDVRQLGLIWQDAVFNDGVFADLELALQQAKNGNNLNNTLALLCCGGLVEDPAKLQPHLVVTANKVLLAMQGIRALLRPEVKLGTLEAVDYVYPKKQLSE